jgi:alkylhydroperoxidase/carboxymuconolactone decarboxylase family protein YurZ
MVQAATKPGALDRKTKELMTQAAPRNDDIKPNMG